MSCWQHYIYLAKISYRCAILTLPAGSLILDQNLLAYMHVYKCGGTSFNWTLQHAFPDKVLYCENSKTSGSRSRINKEQLNQYINLARKRYIALSSHNIIFDALTDFQYVVTTLRDPSARILSAFNHDVRRGDCEVGIDMYIQRRVNFMSKILGDDFIAHIDSSRIFCIVLDQLDISMVALEHFLAINGHIVSLVVPHALNVGSRKKNQPESVVKNLSNAQTELFSKLNKLDICLYESRKKWLMDYVSNIPDFDLKLKNYHDRKKIFVESLPLIKSFGQGPNHFVYI